MDAMQIQPGVISNPFADPARRVILATMILFSSATHGQQPSQADAAVASPDRFTAMQTSVLDQGQVVDAMRTMYVAATGDELMALIRTGHEAGVVYVWRVTDPEVRIDGNTAWITYVNRGSITDVSGAKDVTWLESAVLRQEQGAWRIQFFHSTRVP